MPISFNREPAPEPPSSKRCTCRHIWGRWRQSPLSLTCFAAMINISNVNCLTEISLQVWSERVNLDAEGNCVVGFFFLPLMRLLSTFSMSGCTSLRTSMWVMWCAFLPNIQIGSAWKRAWFVAVVNHTRVLLACQEELLEATVSHSIFKWTGRGWGWIFFSEYLTTYYTVLLWAVGDLSCNDEPGKRASNDKCSPHTLSS